MFTLPGPGAGRKQGLRKKAIVEDLALRLALGWFVADEHRQGERRLRGLRGLHGSLMLADRLPTYGLLPVRGGMNAGGATRVIASQIREIVVQPLMLIS